VFSGEVLTLNEIVRYYSLSKESLIFLMNRILTGKSDILSEFIGYTEDELKEEFKRLQCEVEKCAVFNILTTLEAEFRMDFFIRVKRKYKCSISKKFRDIYKQYEKKHKENRIPLKEEILRVWKEEFPKLKSIIDPYIEALNYRHWLAHGRWWKPKVRYDEKYDFDTVYRLAQSIYDNIPFGERLNREKIKFLSRI